MDVLWGVNFKRFLRRKNEEDLWRAFRRTFGITKVSEAGDLRGIKDIGSGRLFIVKPYALARYDKQSGQDPQFPLTGGVDVKYGLSSNLLLNVTGNTDFADTEGLQPFNFTPLRFSFPRSASFSWRMPASLISRLAIKTSCFQPSNRHRPDHRQPGSDQWRRKTDRNVRPVGTRHHGCKTRVRAVPIPIRTFAIVRLKESLWPGSYVGVMGIDKRSGNVPGPVQSNGRRRHPSGFFSKTGSWMPTWRARGPRES